VGTEGVDLLAGEDDRDARWALRRQDGADVGQIDPEHVAVKKEQRAERHVLGGGGHFSLDGEV
jgi:hypothetical protein